jgi:hypothetical protein
LSEAGNSLLDDVIEGPSDEQQRLTALEARLTALQQQLNKMERYGGWLFAIVAFIALFLLIRR